MGEAEAFRRRHAEHFLATIESATPHRIHVDGPAWLGFLQVEHDNLRAALTWVSGAPGTANMLARVIGPL